MASQSNDPRQPSAARPYKPQLVAPQDLPVDYSGFIAVIFGVLGAMFRYKVWYHGAGDKLHGVGAPLEPQKLGTLILVMFEFCNLSSPPEDLSLSFIMF